MFLFMKSLHYIIKSRGEKYDEQPAFKAVKLCKQYLELRRQRIPAPEPDTIQLWDDIQNTQGLYADTAFQVMKICRGEHQAGNNIDSAAHDICDRALFMPGG